MAKIILFSGKARHGKDTSAEIIKNVYESKGLKVINLSYGSYIKNYAMMISDWDGSEETKPRTLLQELGTDIIRTKIDPNFFIKRLCDDIRVYSYFFDIITISDARFPDELDTPSSEFDDVVKIKVIRDNYESVLTDKEKKHLTETALDNYDDYDFIIHNDGTIEELKEKVEEIVRKL